jgi:transcriptional regulator with XRE-family HTH domain
LSRLKCAFRAFLIDLCPGIVRREVLVTDAQLFGKRLRAARIAAGVKQGPLAKALDVDPKHISRLERGKVKPSFDLICQASRFLKVSPSLLLDLDAAEENSSGLKERIRRLLETTDVKQIQRAYRVLRGLLEP